MVRKRTPKKKKKAGLRLQVAIARAGLASRRKAEELIEEGAVTVNGKVITEQGTRVMPDDHIKVAGKLIPTKPQTPVYILLNKPRGILTTLADDRGRPVVKSLLRGVKERVFPVGRLDMDTEGVLILTNDGELANKLMHPSYEVERRYKVKVRGRPDADTIERLRTGVYLEDGKTPPARVNFSERTENNSWLEIRVREGRNRLIRRMCQAVGHPVMKLRRTRYASLSTSGLKPGQWRNLSAEELHRLRAAVKRKHKRPKRAPAKKKRR